jgi:hypothetical protein
MEFLQHNDKRAKENPLHIQAHLAAPTHRQPLRSQKSLHFTNTPDGWLTIREQLITDLWHKKFTFV